MSSFGTAARQVHRRIYWLRRDLPNLRRLGWRPLILYAGIGGLGDELLCTASLHEWHRRGARNLAVLARHAELFEHHPARPRILPPEHRFVQTAENWRLTLRRPCQWQDNAPDDEDRQIPPADHVIAENCRAAGLQGTISVRPYLSLSPDELQAGQLGGQTAVIHTSGAAARYHYGNKEWYPERFQAVVDALRGRFDFVQLGAAGDPPLTSVRDLRGRTGLREAAAILAGARFFVGLEGFLMHLARAVDTRSVVVFGGHARPDQIGYPCNENLYRPVECAPCWRKNRCDHDRACMREILPAQVVEAVERVCRRRGEPLETAVLTL